MYDDPGENRALSLPLNIFHLCKESLAAAGDDGFPCISNGFQEEVLEYFADVASYHQVPIEGNCVINSDYLRRIKVEDYQNSPMYAFT